MQVFDKIKNIYIQKCVCILCHSMVYIRPESPTKFKREREGKEVGVDKAMSLMT